jgi:hydrogenase/urease accessory protein HupE
LFLSLLGCLSVFGHPIPDVPVRSSFEEDGKCVIQIEIDPRCFDTDPNIAPSLLNEELGTKPEAERTALLNQARDYAAKVATFHFEPLGRISPEWTFKFTGHGGQPLTKPDDVVVMTGSWSTKVPAGIQGYRIRALKEGTLSVPFVNTLRGKPVERMQVLFPGEDSFLLDVTGANASAPTGPLTGAIGQKASAQDWWSTFAEFVRQGFLHVLPMGLDHILFVLGIFLLSREWRPLLWQVSTFTVAHTLTLGLATLGWVNVSPSIVEPIIAGSIAAVALENIFRPRYTPWRLVVVFGFGLIHGLGFAGALRELELPNASLIIGLLGFNVGVEGGQLAVISIALILTAWIRNPAIYRKFVVIPGSLAIAAMGLWWMAQRLGWIEG